MGDMYDAGLVCMGTGVIGDLCAWDFSCSERSEGGIRKGSGDSEVWEGQQRPCQAGPEGKVGMSSYRQY